jgi:hypothetical protein
LIASILRSLIPGLDAGNTTPLKSRLDDPLVAILSPRTFAKSAVSLAPFVLSTIRQIAWKKGAK